MTLIDLRPNESRPAVRRDVSRENLRPTAGRPPSLAEIAWASGLYEGEGSVTGVGQAFITQKEPWVLLRVRDLFGGTVGGPYVWTTRRFYRWHAAGARGRGFLMTVYPFLSPRRQRQIRQVLAHWREPSGRELVEKALQAIRGELGAISE